MARPPVPATCAQRSLECRNRRATKNCVHRGTNAENPFNLKASLVIERGEHISGEHRNVRAIRRAYLDRVEKPVPKSSLEKLASF